MSYDKGLRNADIWSYNGLQATLCGPFQEWPSKAHPASGASDLQPSQAYGKMHIIPLAPSLILIKLVWGFYWAYQWF